MRDCPKKKHVSHAKNWISLLNSAGIKQKNSVNPTYNNLYAYAANNPIRYIDPDGRSNLYYYIIIKGQKNRNGGYNFFSFSIIYSSDKNELQKNRNKDYSKLSFEKKLNKSAPVFTESDEFLDDHKGQTSPMTEAVILSDIYEDDLNLDNQDGDSSVKTTEKFEIPYDGSPEVTLKSIDEYLNKIKNEETQTEDSGND